MANVAALNRIGSALAPFSNALATLPGAAAFSEWLTGVDHRRSLPRFARHHFPKWFARHRPHPHAGRNGRVVLLDDCLTSYCEPDINQAAVELLEEAGFAVERAGLWCCGRPFISKGLVEKGKLLARRNVGRLAEFVDEGLPILGAEPSCLLTLVDEYPDLFPSAATERVKANAFLVDGWLADQIASGKAHLEFERLDTTVLLHGHCQQKALTGTAGTRNALGLIPGLTVRELDSGCCGMAGSFGYEHYDISMKIGNRVLFPALRGDAAAPVAVPGFSCRHQIADGTGRQVSHPVSLLRQQLQRAERSATVAAQGQAVSGFAAR